ncbi:uncharacterized protein F5891DRAFT_988465 [Suillus fuscotomentosus]|uniref:Uncharacterized protein n=1 Tax=Suillus fuscotomentosus TaxID=1912939 RepID=A0AAD4DP42_9AGAM|nr:uncharacterized protein F5891DRAFT_988465 [Suillus fuscotomentosus]KAG1887398.1 hypothetical protein F5891DRAFT_988465 [Suillus fuscotomentosus]
MQAGERRRQLREWFRNNSKGKTTPGSSSTGKALSALLGQRARGTRNLKEVEVLSAVRQHTTDCFADESDEVKKEIREETDSRTKEEVYHYHHGKTADGLSFKACTPNFHEQYLSPFERHLGCIYEDESTSPHLPPGLISLENKSLVINVLDPSLDFNALAGTKEHDTPITAWRKSTAFDEYLLTTSSPTFNRTQWPGVSVADPSVEAIPPLMFHPLSSFHTTLLPQPASLLAQQMNQFSALEEVNGLSMELHGNPLPFNQPMFNLGPHTPPDAHIPLSLLMTITPSLLSTSTPPESIHFKSTEHQPLSAPHQPLSIDWASSAASRQLSPCDIRGVLAGKTLQPSLETGTVSLLPVVSAASNRRTKRPPCPSTGAAEANKIGVKQGTKPAPKRKQTEVQRSVWKPTEVMALINKGIQDVWSRAFAF